MSATPTKPNPDNPDDAASAITTNSTTVLSAPDMAAPVLPLSTSGKVLTRTGAIIGVPLLFLLVSVVAVSMHFSSTITATAIVSLITIIYTLITRHYLIEFVTKRLTELNRDTRVIARQALPGPMMGWIFAALAAAWFAAQCLAKTTYAVVGSAGFEQYNDELSNANPWLVLLLAVFLAPISEELLMRGTIYPLLRLSMAVTPAIAITALIFGAIHGNIVQFVLTVPLTIIAALVYEWSRNIGYCILMHLTFNAMSVFVPSFWLSQMAENNAVLPVSMAALTGVVAWVCMQQARGVWTHTNMQAKYPA